MKINLADGGSRACRRDLLNSDRWDIIQKILDLNFLILSYFRLRSDLIEIGRAISLEALMFFSKMNHSLYLYISFDYRNHTIPNTFTNT